MTTTTKKKKTAKKKAEVNDAEIRVRINAKTKKQAEKLFEQHGLTTSDGIRLLLNRAITEKELPRIPNAETQKAMEEARSGEGEVIPHSDLKNRLLGKS